MNLDKRNPFAPWGFEEEVYAVNVAENDECGMVELVDNGFINETVKEESYNKIAEPITSDKYVKIQTEQQTFFTNDENMLNPGLQTKAYGENVELQREFQPGENLEYYGNEADDLTLYGEKNEENTESGDDNSGSTTGGGDANSGSTTGGDDANSGSTAGGDDANSGSTTEEGDANSGSTTEEGE